MTYRCSEHAPDRRILEAMVVEGTRSWPLRFVTRFVAEELLHVEPSGLYLSPEHPIDGEILKTVDSVPFLVSVRTRPHGLTIHVEPSLGSRPDVLVAVSEDMYAQAAHEPSLLRLDVFRADRRHLVVDIPIVIDR